MYSVEAAKRQRRFALSGLFAAAIVAALALGFVGARWDSSDSPVSKPSRSIPPMTAVDTAYAWFDAVNHHDLDLATAYMEPDSRGSMHWDTFDSVHFSNVSCHVGFKHVDVVEVGCTFSAVTNPPDWLERPPSLDLTMVCDPADVCRVRYYGQV